MPSASPLFTLALLFLFIVAFCYSKALRAETVTVSLGDLHGALETAAQLDDKVSREVLQRVANTLNSADVGFSNGELLYQSSDTNITVEGGCNNTEILQVETDIVLASDTTFTLELNSLYDPIVVSVNVLADIDSVGVARSTAGVRLGDCRNLARDTFDFHAQGQASLSISLSLFLAPEWTSQNTLSLYPSIQLNGELLSLSSSVDVDDTVLASLIESYIEDEINDTLTNDRLTAELASLQSSANGKLEQSLTDGRIDIDLPDADDEQILALYQLLQPDARFPITLDMIRRNRNELLASILFGEPSSPDAIFADSLLCESAAAFLDEPNLAPLYSRSEQQCSVVSNLDAQYAELWLDDQ